MSCYVYTRLLSYHAFNIALLFGIFLALEIMINKSIWSNVFYDFPNDLDISRQVKILKKTTTLLNLQDMFRQKLLSSSVDWFTER